jgi:integrase
MFREPAGKTRFLSPDEEVRLCEKIGAPYAGWVRLAILTGMRQMEQFSLRWEHVDLERGVLTLPTTKAGGVQYVRLNEEVKGLLQGFIPGNKSVWVFPSLNPDTHADPRNFYRRVFLSHGWYPHLSASHLQQEIEKVSAFVRQVSRQ